MTARLLLWALAVGAGAPDQLAIRWNAGGPGAAASIEVTGLDAANLAALAQADWDTARWARLFSVHLAPAGAPPSPFPIAGRYRVVADVLRFEPRFPIEPGLRHEARLRPAQLPVVPRDAGDLTSSFTKPAPAPSAPALVVRVDPAGDRLPENLIRFYLHFSKPMSRGKAYGHVCILDSSGQALAMPFLELGEELWDPSGTRLTLLLDPGRIKRGLRPRLEEGPILEAGKSYTLVIDRAWPDAEGHPMRAEFRRSFEAGPMDESQPDPKTWKVAAPAAGSTEPLTLTFPEPLDRAMLDRAIVVQGPDELTIAGQVQVNTEATRWQFRPAQPWPKGAYELVVDGELEDRAGNSIARPFEVDAIRPLTRRIESRTVTIPVTIGK